MARYIELDTLLAEIEGRLEEYRTYPDYQIDSNYMELCEILSFINTLEVKEVDLDFVKEVDGWIEDNGDSNGFFNVDELAKYFFELGLKEQKEK